MAHPSLPWYCCDRLQDLDKEDDHILRRCYWYVGWSGMIWDDGSLSDLSAFAAFASPKYQLETSWNHWTQASPKCQASKLPSISTSIGLRQRHSSKHAEASSFCDRSTSKSMGKFNLFQSFVRQLVKDAFVPFFAPLRAAPRAIWYRSSRQTNKQMEKHAPGTPDSNI